MRSSPAERAPPPPSSKRHVGWSPRAAQAFLASGRTTGDCCRLGDAAAMRRLLGPLSAVIIPLALLYSLSAFRTARPEVKRALPPVLYGITTDTIRHASELVEGAAHLPIMPTTRVYFDVNKGPNGYTASTPEHASDSARLASISLPAAQPWRRRGESCTGTTHFASTFVTTWGATSGGTTPRTASLRAGAHFGAAFSQASGRNEEPSAEAPPGTAREASSTASASISTFQRGSSNAATTTIVAAGRIAPKVAR